MSSTAWGNFAIPIKFNASSIFIKAAFSMVCFAEAKCMIFDQSFLKAHTSTGILWNSSYALNWDLEEMRVCLRRGAWFSLNRVLNAWYEAVSIPRILYTPCSSGTNPIFLERHGSFARLWNKVSFKGLYKPKQVRHIIIYII